MTLKKFFTVAASAAALTFAAGAQAKQERTLCVWDIVGKSGDMYNIMKDFGSEAVSQGYDFKLRTYTDENIAAEDLKAGQCDAAAITGLRGRQFNSFTGSLDSMGSIPNDKVLRTIVQVLSSNNPSIKEKMRSGSYEVYGVAPMGAAYLFVKDNTMTTVGDLAGKSISVMEYDVAQAKMAASVGMSPVLSDITNFAGRFNNHSVDISFAPLLAYRALELYKGLEPNGGIVDFVLGQLTLQFIVRHEKFDDDFGDWSRQYFYNKVLDRAFGLIDNGRKDVDDKWWIEISGDDYERYEEMLRDARINLTKEGVYNQDMMQLLRNLRCRLEADRAECSDEREVYN